MTRTPGDVAYDRPRPSVGDATSAAERAADPTGWAFDTADVRAFDAVLGARRDIRRFRPDPLPWDVLEEILTAGHRAPSVGQSQPWRFVVVRDAGTKDRARSLADAERLRQASSMTAEAGRRLRDLQLDGIADAPVGVVVCCDRRSPAVGVLGRATFQDADVWSCACAIQNMWLAARARGVGLGWVTLFQPEDLLDLVGAPEGFVTLGWLCMGFPDERPPEPGLQRAGWSKRLPLADVVVQERFGDAPAPPTHYAPGAGDVVAGRDSGDALLTPPGSLGVLDEAVNAVLATVADGTQHGAGDAVEGVTLIVGVGQPRVAELGVTAFEPRVGDDLLDASRRGVSLGAATARAAGLGFAVYDCGPSDGNGMDAPALSSGTMTRLLDLGAQAAAHAPARHLIAVGEIGIGNTTTAAACAAALLGVDPAEVTGLGSASDTAIVDRKREVVAASLARCGWGGQAQGVDPWRVLTELGSPEMAFIAGLIREAARRRRVVVLDGLLTGVAALVACRAEPWIGAYLLAGQRSRERAHGAVLDALGKEAVLDGRFRAGEGVGAAHAARLVLNALSARAATARTLG